MHGVQLHSEIADQIYYLGSSSLAFCLFVCLFLITSVALTPWSPTKAECAFFLLMMEVKSPFRCRNIWWDWHWASFVSAVKQGSEIPRLCHATVQHCSNLLPWVQKPPTMPSTVASEPTSLHGSPSRRGWYVSGVCTWWTPHHPGSCLSSTFFSLGSRNPRFFKNWSFMIC